MTHQTLLTFLCMMLIAASPSLSAATPEETYFLNRIVEDLRRTCDYADDRTVDWKATVKTMPTVHGLWNPESYQSFLEAHLPNPAIDPTEPSPELAGELLNPTSPGMALASQELSIKLTKHPSSPSLHDGAALLLCALALRENSGRFYDVRTILCRITAHLAFARHLSPKPTTNGRLAMTLLETFKGNGINAAALSAELPAVPGDWKEIVDMAITGDWRPSSGKPSVLYQFLRTKAVLSSGNGQLSRQEVDRIATVEKTLRNRTDWHRIFLQDPPTRKFVLNQLTRANLLEAAEMGAVLMVLGMKASAKNDLIAMLNTRSGYTFMPDPVGLPKARVIDWGLWAEHYQRHVCHVLTYFPATHVLERQFSGLNLLPFVLLQQRKRPNGLDRGVLKRTVELCNDTPELINATNWLHTRRLLDQAITDGPNPFLPLTYSPYLSASVRKRPALGFVPATADLLKRLPDPMTWFSATPAGSRYNATYRFEMMDNALREETANTNPWLPSFIRWKLEGIRGGRHSLQELDEVAGARSQFDLNIMRLELSLLIPDSAEVTTIMARMAKMSPTAQIALARHHFFAGRHDMAMTTFLMASERQVSPANVATQTPWLLDLLVAAKKADVAMIFAEKGAQHGKAGHRLQYLDFLASTDLAIAEKRAHSLQKHFPTECPLLYFHLFMGRLKELHGGANNVSTALGEIRHRPSYSEAERLLAFKRAAEVIFPGGKERADATHFKYPPTSRLATSRVQDVTLNKGVAKGDVLVAINGTRVQDVYHYHYLRREILATTATLTLWNSKRGYYRHPCELKTWDKDTALKITDKRPVIPARIAMATTYLDLSGLGLTVIPEGVFDLTTLKQLDVSNNPLTTLPESLIKLTNLETLKASNCGLTTVPKSLGELKALKSLSLDSNDLTTLPTPICALAAILKLDLRDNDIEELPTAFFELSSLKTLLLAGNRIKTLPNHTSRLTALENLNLGNNDIDVFPEAACSLPNLKRLLLYGNAIRTIPSSIGTATKLVRLDIRRNGLASLPTELGNATEMETLHMGANRFKTIPPVVFEFSKLKDLDMGRNLLIALPDRLSKLKKLRRLIISDNRLDTLPDFLGTMPELAAVYYGGNPIRPQVVARLMSKGAKTKYSAVTYE